MASFFASNSWRSGRDEEGKGGGLSTLTMDIPVEAREKMLAISYLYSLLELKSGLMETEFRPGFGQLVRVICRHAGIAVEAIVQTWTRTSVRNDAELAEIAQKSTGVVSKKTILSNHPWVADAEKELAQIAEEKKEAMEKADQYGGAFASPGRDGEGGGGGIDGENDE